MKEILLGPGNDGPRLWVWGRPWSHWRTIRLWLLLIWSASFVAWLPSHAEVASLSFKFLSPVVVAVLTWPWVRGPYLLYTRHALPLRRGYLGLVTNAVPPEFKNHVSDSIEKLGFKPASVLTSNSFLTRVSVQVMMYVHPGNRDSAQVGHITKSSGVLPVLVFKSRFADGFAFETSNSRSARIFPSDPDFPVFRFPQLRSVSDVYRLHRRIKQDLETCRVPVISDAEQELREFVSRAEVVHQRNVSRDYVLDGDRYRLTLRGAIRRAWLMTWPIKIYRHMRVEREGMKKAAELGLPIHPIFGCLQESARRRSAS